VAGSALGSSNQESFTLARYYANGKIDSQFGKGGIVETAIGTSATAYAIALQSDGKVVVAGTAALPQHGLHIALARYLGDPIPQTGPGIAGVAMLGPIFPVSRVGVSDFRPLPGATISIQSAGGTQVALVGADQNGKFLIHLPPGTYRLIPLPAEPRLFYPRGLPQTVVVEPGPAFTDVTVDYDSGIV
jgi:hypothetical protein